MKKYNFSPGPAILPQVVFEEASAAVKEFAGTGFSILEISHRSAAFKEILEEGEALIKEILHLNDDYEVLFLTGGASSQFYMSAMNLLANDKTAAYLDTGTWSTKAIKEAKLFGDIDVVASSKESNFNYIPKDFQLKDNTSYLHLTSNNTIFGTQIHTWPDVDVPLVCDMSSDIFSRKLPTEKFGMIYAGAQKNTGPAGVTLVVIRKDMLGKVERAIPTMLDYQTHITKKSAFNTPPVFPIYVSVLNLRWLKAHGGIEEMQKTNEHKAGLLYNAIDQSEHFVGTSAKEDRSMMNVCFLMNDPSREGEFLAAATAAGCESIKGHRSVGGFRASIYNAMPVEGVETLIKVINDFS